mmetsp:Transcript_1447/g.3441  ORF Transcript_1447/g.3441 Transcript_1447/m.3441 type:complete len:312 (+) Transcript_1447:111-1046(+)
MQPPAVYRHAAARRRITALLAREVVRRPRLSTPDCGPGCAVADLREQRLRHRAAGGQEVPVGGELQAHDHGDGSSESSGEADPGGHPGSLPPSHIQSRQIHPKPTAPTCLHASPAVPGLLPQLEHIQAVPAGELPREAVGAEVLGQPGEEVAHGERAALCRASEPPPVILQRVARPPRHPARPHGRGPARPPRPIVREKSIRADASPVLADRVVTPVEARKQQASAPGLPRRPEHLHPLVLLAAARPLALPAPALVLPAHPARRQQGGVLRAHRVRPEALPCRARALLALVPLPCHGGHQGQGGCRENHRV